MPESYDEMRETIARCEDTEVIGAALGALSLGSCATVAFGEVITSQPEHDFFVLFLASVGVIALASATAAGRRIGALQREMRRLDPNNVKDSGSALPTK